MLKKTLCALCASVVIITGCSTPQPEPSKTEELKSPLRRPTEEVETEPLTAKIQQLIAHLGDDDWGTREKATQELIVLGEKIKPILAKYETHPDPEVRQRISYIIAEIGRNKNDWKSIIESNHNNVGEARILLSYDESVSTALKTSIKIELLSVQKVIPDWKSLTTEIENIYNICKTKNIAVPMVIDPEPKVPMQSIIYALDACRKAGITHVRFAGKSSPK